MKVMISKSASFGGSVVDANTSYPLKVIDKIKKLSEGTGVDFNSFNRVDVIGEPRTKLTLEVHNDNGKYFIIDTKGRKHRV